MLENLKARESNVEETQYNNSIVEQQINTIFSKIYHALTDENENKEESSAQVSLFVYSTCDLNSKDTVECSCHF